MTKKVNYFALGIGVFVGGLIAILISKYLGESFSRLQGAISFTLMFLCGLVGSRLKLDN